jgi:CHASE1-domain containing sensor protein
MLSRGKKLLITTSVFIVVSLIATFLVQPFSLLNFIGPMAGIASAFTIVWGYSVLISIIVTMILFSLILMLVTGNTLDFSIFLVATLTIILQSCWAKQLSTNVVRQQRWLKRRSVLFGFIFKIGPLAGIVSAFSVVVIAVIDTETFGSSVNYIFFSSWSSSILMVVFVTPILLFTQGVQKLSLTKRLFIIFSSLLACLAVALLFQISQNLNQHERVESYQKNKAVVLNLLVDEMEMIREQLDSQKAFFSASEKVTNEEFTLFSSNIYRKYSSVRALSWAPLIHHNNRDKFEQLASEQLISPFLIKNQLQSQKLLVAEPSVLYLPITYLFPRATNEAMYGLNLLGDYSYSQHQLQTINKSIHDQKAIASAPLSLVQDDISQPAFFVFYPVFNDNIAQFSTRELQDVKGVVVAVVQFNHFFERLVKLKLTRGLSISVRDISSKEPFILLGQYLSENAGHDDLASRELKKMSEQKGRYTETLILDVFSRKWQVTISEKTAWVNQIKSWQPWAMLLGGTLGGFTFQLLILMMSAYSTELSHQVSIKTKELLQAKDKLEQKNRVQGDFIKSLTSELTPAIHAIKHFIAKFRQHPTFQQAELSIEEISQTSQHLSQLIDTVTDLSNIESGKSAIQLSVFDFRALLRHVEGVLNSRNNDAIMLKFLIHESVPTFIDCDELRIRNLLILLVENADKIFSCKNYCVTIKAHTHLKMQATIFIVVSPLGYANTLFDNELDTEQQQTTKNSTPALSLDENAQPQSISMIMAKEISLLFDGNVNLNNRFADDLSLNASIKVNLPSRI